MILRTRNCQLQKFDKRKILYFRRPSRRTRRDQLRPFLLFAIYDTFVICRITFAISFFFSTNNFIAFRYSDLESISLMVHKFGAIFRADKEQCIISFVGKRDSTGISAILRTVDDSSLNYEATLRY